MTTFIRKLVGAGAALAAATPLFAHVDEHQKITAPDGIPGDLFGHSVAISEDLIAVGAPAQDINGADSGSVYVVERVGLNWAMQTKLLAFDGAPLDRFGESVGISGHTIAVGAPQDDDLGAKSGAVYVFVQTAGVWSLEAKLMASDGVAGDRFGASVDVEGDRILVGAPGHDLVGVGFDAGAAYIFDRSAAVWTEVFKCVASDPGARNLFGTCVAIEGTGHGHSEHADARVIVGAPQDSDVVPNGGSAYVFRLVTPVWSEEIKLTDLNAADNDRFGSAVDILEGVAVVGSPLDDEFVLDGGSIFMFDETSHAWPQVAHFFGVGPASNPNRLMGSAVAIMHGTVMIGAPLEEVGANTDAGLIHLLFTEELPMTGELATTDTPADNAHLGVSVAVSGCWMVAGADRDSILGPNSGSISIYPGHSHLETYCTAGTSAAGCQALLGATGIPSASAPSGGFVLSASSLEGEKDGLFYFSTNGQQAATWNGSTSFQCVVPPVIRTPLAVGSGTAGACDGLTEIDLNALWGAIPAKNPGGGAVVYAQFWYRDPFNTSGAGTSLSDAISFEVCP